MVVLIPVCARLWGPFFGPPMLGLRCSMVVFLHFQTVQCLFCEFAVGIG